MFVLDDDVVLEFLKEKEDEVEKSKPKEVDLTLPGQDPLLVCIKHHLILITPSQPAIIQMLYITWCRLGDVGRRRSCEKEKKEKGEG